MLTINPSRWDIFCRVEDNFGDIGFCWRLARQLCQEHRIDVVLWLNDWPRLARIWPDATSVGVRLKHWQDDTVVDALGAVVIAAFSCALPASAIDWLKRHPKHSLWLNLEYLSAESWIDRFHGLPSLQAQGVRPYFFFPGFTPESGGLIAEKHLAGRAAWNAAQGTQWLVSTFNIPIHPHARLISLFAYHNAAIVELLAIWMQSTCPIHALVFEGPLLTQIADYLGHAMGLGKTYYHGALSLTALPFISQDDYDRLLWSCELNFVRGEDSFVRAQWAEQVLCWHIYPQSEEAHEAKLSAWLDRYTAMLPHAAAAWYRQWTWAWNRQTGVDTLWPALETHWPQLSQHAAAWAAGLRENGNLAAKLMTFVRSKIH